MSCCSLALVACGDDDDQQGGGEDGGVSSFPQVEMRLDEVSEELTDLQGDVDGVNMDVAEANEKIDGLEETTTDLDMRLDDVEADLNAPDPTCSEDEACMPNGVMEAHDELKSIVEQLCTFEVTCCNEDELNYKFGPGITNVAECTTTFTDLVNNGFSPDFISTNGVFINRVINIAQAINSNDVQVTLDSAAVTACVDHLKKRECPKYAEPGEPVLHCTPDDFEAATDPCAIKLLAKGAQGEGEVCGITGIDECGMGLVCRRNAGGSQIGLCAKSSEVDDRCRRDADCDGTEQFCNLGTGKCQERSDEGEDCEYVDATFSNNIDGLHPGFGGGAGWQNPSALKIECKQGLTCDPASKKCVKFCSKGAICSSNANCPEGQICNLTEVANLYSTFRLGTCSDPIAVGGACTCNTLQPPGVPCPGSDGASQECASARCAFDGVTDLRNECAEPFKAAGESCSLTTAGTSKTDPSCASNRCGTDAKCAAECTTQSDCPSTHYCANPQGQPIGFEMTSTPGKFACEPKKANDVSCTADNDGNPFDDLQCASGNCENGTTCKPKVAAGGTCPATLQHSACTNQFCKSDGQAVPTFACTAFVAAGGTCASTPDCGPGSYCGTDGSNLNKCVAYIASGGVCDMTNDIRCNPAAALQCITVGSATQCHEPGKYPVGAVCDGPSQLNSMGMYVAGDNFCTSTWCRGDGTCQNPLAEGADCDDDDSEKNRCADGTYCKYENLPTSASAYGEGTCTDQGTAGQPCDPRFGNDCVDPGFCELKNDAFVCSQASIVVETHFCDGED